jgi:glycosyltransferase involved in cell wall biosynthesis
MARLAPVVPEARLLVIGRGTHLEETARRPAARLGLSERVVFAGYRSADYPDVLRASDVFTMLVPGSDGGCRALLEAAGCGLPAVTTGLGSLPEIVLHGETGLVVAEDPAQLAAAWRSLLESASLRQTLGAAARRRAESCFTPARLAEQVEGLYQATFRAR